MLVLVVPRRFLVVELRVLHHRLSRQVSDKFGTGLGNLSSKTGSETGFLAENLDRLLDRDFRAELKTGKQNRFKTGSQAGQGILFCLKRLSQVLSPVLKTCFSFLSLIRPENLCPVSCLDFEPENLPLSLFFVDRLPRTGSNWTIINIAFKINCNESELQKSKFLCWNIVFLVLLVVSFGITTQSLVFPNEPRGEFLFRGVVSRPFSALFLQSNDQLFQACSNFF